MTMGIRRIVICILIISILACGCTSANKNRPSENTSAMMPGDNSTLPPDKFVAVAFIVKNTGTIVSSETPMFTTEKPTVDFFNYMPSQYNASDYPSNYPSRDGLKILLGLVHIEDSPYDVEAHIDDVVGVYQLPVTILPYMNITKVYENGTIEITYDDETIGRYEVLAGGTNHSITVGIPCKNESLYDQVVPGWASHTVAENNVTINAKVPGISGKHYNFTLCYRMNYEIDNKGVFNKY